MFSLLQRVIFYELFRVFILCWIGLTGMILLGGVIAEAAQQGFGPAQVLGIIPFLIPSLMPYTLPTTSLFATCVVYGRLAHDNEVLAVKAAGINLIQIAIPAIFLGVAASVGTMVLYYDLIPSTHWQLVVARSHLVNNFEEFVYNVLRKDGHIHHPDLDYEIDVQRVEGRDLIDAVFKHRDKKNGGYDLIARGKKADISVDKEKRLVNIRLFNGSIQRGDDNGFNVGWQPLTAVELKALDVRPKARPTDMTWHELAEFHDKFNEEIEKKQDIIRSHEAIMIAGAAPQEFFDHVMNTNNEIKMLQGSLAQIAAEYQMRPALSLGCLCFVLVGCPVGIWFSRSDYLSSFITCFLPIVVLYYPLMLCGINLAKAGKMPPALVIWPANALIALAAAFLLRRLMRN